MYLGSSRVFIQTATAPLVRPASVTMVQRLNSVTAQGNCQSKTFHAPTFRVQLKKKSENKPEGGRTEVTTNRPSKFATSPTQLTNISVGSTKQLIGGFVSLTPCNKLCEFRL